MPTATHGSHSVEIAAPPERVYAIVADITSMGERSPECCRCEWLDGAAGAVVGARFRGYNRIGPLRWSTTCVITTADVGRELAFDVMSGHGRLETQWRYALEPAGSITRLTESYQFVWCPALARVAEIPFPRDRQLRRGLVETLDHVKRLAETG